VHKGRQFGNLTPELAASFIFISLVPGFSIIEYLCKDTKYGACPRVPAFAEAPADAKALADKSADKVASGLTYFK